jgi:hypothetical protein
MVAEVSVQGFWDWDRASWQGGCGTAGLLTSWQPGAEREGEGRGGREERESLCWLVSFFSTLVPSGPQPIGWCCPHSGFPHLVNCLWKCPHRHPEVCFNNLLGVYQFNQVDNQD